MYISSQYVSEEVIELLHANGEVSIDDCFSLDVNEYVIFKGIESGGSYLARHKGAGSYVKLAPPDKKSPIQPKDVEQKCAADSIQCPDLSLNVLLGAPGTGKTTLAVYYALQEAFVSGRKIILTKPAVMVGNAKAFGAVPGTIAEKYEPYLASFRTVIEKFAGPNGLANFKKKEEKKEIEFMPLELVRGCTFDNTIVILDEAQNLTWHELYTFISRLGENSKMIILADSSQIDTRQRWEETGVYKLLETKSFRKNKLTSFVKLHKVYRSAIAQLMFEVNKEISGS